LPSKSPRELKNLAQIALGDSVVGSGSVTKGGKIKASMSAWSVWSVVEQCAKEIGIERFWAHDLRRTCAKLCRKSGGDLEQIKFLLGHSSIQTTERYLGSEQEIAIAVNDSLGL